MADDKTTKTPEQPVTDSGPGKETPPAPPKEPEKVSVSPEPEKKTEPEVKNPQVSVYNFAEIMKEKKVEERAAAPSGEKPDPAKTEKPEKQPEAPKKAEEKPKEPEQPKRRGRPPKADKDKDAAPKSKAPAQKPEKAVKKEPEKKTAPTVQTAPTPKKPEKPQDAPRRGKEQIVYIKLNELHAFKNHPFEVRDDEEMRAMVSSVKDKGVTQPAIVRPREDGGYEIVSGHRRQKASELAGYADMPCIVRNLTDDEAITQMVEDNLNQREEILPSERAKALKMQLEAIKHQGSRTSGQIDPKDAGKRSNEIVAERNKMAVKQVQRYIRLNELVPDLMKLMDEKKLGFTTAVELSYVLTVRTVLRTPLLIAPELLDLLLQVFAVTALKQLAGLANLNQFRDTTDVCTQHRRAVHLGFHHRERAVLIPLRRIDGEPCLTDELFQCFAFLEADVFDVLNTIYRLFQRTSAGEDELDIRQVLTDLDECADALFFREATKVKDVVFFLRLFPLHLVDEVVHCHGLRCKQRIAVHLGLHELRAADHGVNVLIGILPLPELRFHHADG